jgi:hypothetical protein
MKQQDKLTLEECKQLLGQDGEGWSDEKIERLRDRLEALAHELFGEIGQRAAENLEDVRWAAYLHRNGFDESDIVVDPVFDDENGDDTGEDDTCRVQ